MSVNWHPHEKLVLCVHESELRVTCQSFSLFFFFPQNSLGIQAIKLYLNKVIVKKERLNEATSCFIAYTETVTFYFKFGNLDAMVC